MLRDLMVGTFYRATATRSDAPSELSGKWLALSTLRRFLQDQRIDTVLDVGANCGQFAAKLRRLGFRGTILSFEPDPRAFAELQARHQGDPHWHGYPMGLGDENGMLSFHLAGHSVLSSFLAPVRPENVAEVVTIPVQRLDAVLDGALARAGVASPRILLKTDTQGYDLHVLRGAAGCMPRIAGILAELSVLPIYEGSPSLTQSLDAYREAGFDLADLSVVNKTPDGRLLEMDGLFVRRPE
ncbi:MAG TPA: FkbM family methyltransferase [Longimicrobium sp.]|jgi:FkbM family methyltransferase